MILEGVLLLLVVGSYATSALAGSVVAPEPASFVLRELAEFHIVGCRPVTPLFHKVGHIAFYYL